MNRSILMRRNTIAIAIAVGLLLLLAACSDSDDSSATSDAPTSTDAPAPLKVNLAWGNYDIGNPHIALALRDDAFSQNGLDVEVQFHTTGRDGLTALLGGQADLAVMAEFPAVIAALQGEGVRVVADLSSFDGLKVMTRTDVGISTLADLEGKKIGVPVGTNMQFGLETALGSVGLDGTDFELVALPVTGLAGALEKGDIDAAMPFDSFYAGFEEVLGDRYAEIPTVGYSFHFILVADPNVSDDVIRRFLQALKDVDPQLADREQALANILESGGDRINPAYAEWAFFVYDYSLDLNQDLVDLLLAEGQWLVETQDIAGDPPADLFRSIVDPGPLEAVAPGSSDLQ